MADGENLDDMLEGAMRENETKLFNESLKEPEAAPEKVTEDKPEQARDEQGKFAKAEEKPQADEQPKAEAKVDTKADTDAMVPSSRLREVTDKSRKVEEENTNLRNLLTQLNARLATLDQPKPQQQQQQPENKLDPIIDPDGFVKALKDDFDKERRADRLNFSMALAQTKHGEVFDKAYEAILAEKNAGNMQLVHQLTSGPNPGEAIVQWHRNQMVLKEVGSDPAAYRQKMRDELLKDPEFIKAALEAARNSAGQPQGQNPVVKLPPSLSRVAGSQANDQFDGDGSDEAIFRSAMSR